MSDPAVETTLDDELHALAAPIRERLKRVEAELQQAQANVERIKADRTKIRSALRAVDPTYEHPNAPGPKKAKIPPSHTWSEDAVERAVEALKPLRAELNGHEFTAAEISRRDEWPFSSSYTAVLFAVLHDRRVLRLTRKGRGTSKLYQLV